MQAIQQKVGSKVRALRKKKGWSQDVFADRSRLHRAHVSEIERGESNVALQTLKLGSRGPADLLMQYQKEVSCVT